MPYITQLGFTHAPFVLLYGFFLFIVSRLSLRMHGYSYLLQLQALVLVFPNSKLTPPMIWLLFATVAFSMNA
jgi:hypothetical protein